MGQLSLRTFWRPYLTWRAQVWPKAGTITYALSTLPEARGATEAIQVMENRGDQIDLAVTDVLMPGMKGRELVERLDELRSDLKVLYMSAYTEDAAINIGVLSPGTEFIDKPFSPDELAARVRQVLEALPSRRRMCLLSMRLRALPGGCSQAEACATVACELRYGCF